MASEPRRWEGGEPNEKWTLEVYRHEMDGLGVMLAAFSEIGQHTAAGLTTYPFLSCAQAREVAAELVRCADEIEAEER